ncbi:MAG: AraC family transcriptional regulator [Myxococcales bacterium]|jgi:AraC-like DNA-binding protein
MLFRLSVAGLRYLGVDVDAALERIGMTQADLEKLPARVPASLGIRYWNAIEEVTGRTDLGLALAELTRPEMFDVTGYVVRHSPTLGDAIRRLTRFGRLVGEGLDVVLEVQGDRAVIRQPSIPGHVDHPQLTQCFLATLGRLARQLTGESLRAIEVHMVHDAPPNAEQLAALFEAPIHYNAPFNGFVVEASMLQAPMLGHDARLGAILERQAEQLLEQLPERGGFVRRVQELLTEELNGGNPNADHIAARLDLSTRTLSRRLKAAATSHQTLLDQLRHELATRYLRNTELDVSEIAFVLGFSDASALNRAFKRWAGMTPTEYRRGVASG